MSESSNEEDLPATNPTINDILAYCVSWRVNDFYARLIATLPSRAEKKVGAMGVTFERQHLVLLYNPEWIAARLAEGMKGFNEIRATFAHEAFHIILCHIPRQMRLYRTYYEPAEQKRFLQRSNIAADMADNDLLRRELAADKKSIVYTDLQTNAKAWVLPEQMKFPEGLSYEWYLSLMMDKALCPECTVTYKTGKCTHSPGEGRDEPSQGKHEGAHALWVTYIEDLSDEEIEIAATHVEQDIYEKVQQAVEQHERSRGTVPGFVKERMEELLKPPQVPWKRLLHNFVTRCRLSKPMRTMERPRKRWGLLGTTLYPGVKRDKTFRLYYGIDTSGSMSAEDITEGLIELQALSRVDRDIEIIVVEFDTQIQKEYTLTANGQVDVEVKGRGGTDFNEFFKRCVELEKKGQIDAAICFTDGFAPAPELQYRPQQLPVMFCLVEQGQHPCPGYGFEIRRPRGTGSAGHVQARATTA